MEVIKKVMVSSPQAERLVAVVLPECLLQGAEQSVTAWECQHHTEEFLKELVPELCGDPCPMPGFGSQGCHTGGWLSVGVV